MVWSPPPSPQRPTVSKVRVQVWLAQSNLKRFLVFMCIQNLQGDFFYFTPPSPFCLKFRLNLTVAKGWVTGEFSKRPLKMPPFHWNCRKNSSVLVPWPVPIHVIHQSPLISSSTLYPLLNIMWYLATCFQLQLFTLCENYLPPYVWQYCQYSFNTPVKYHVRPGHLFPVDLFSSGSLPVEKFQVRALGRKNWSPSSSSVISLSLSQYFISFV